MTQKSFITGSRSLNEEDLHDNLVYFKVPQGGIDSIRSKLAFKIFDEYANILKGMYSMRLNGRPKNKGYHDQIDTVPGGLEKKVPLESPFFFSREKKKKMLATTAHYLQHGRDVAFVHEWRARAQGHHELPDAGQELHFKIMRSRKE